MSARARQLVQFNKVIAMGWYWLVVEAAVALGLLLFIVWYTFPKKDKGDDEPK